MSWGGELEAGWGDSERAGSVGSVLPGPNPPLQAPAGRTTLLTLCADSRPLLHPHLLNLYLCITAGGKDCGATDPNHEVFPQE